MRKSKIVLAVAAGAALTFGVARADELIGTRVMPWSKLREEQVPGGTLRRYLDAPTSTLLRLGLRLTRLEGGGTPHPVRPHTRTNEGLVLVKEGTLEVRLDTVVHRLEEGSAVFLGPNQWHAFRNPGSEPVSYYEIEWTSPGMNGEAPSWPETAPPTLPRPPRTR